jgi:hypothetical protein
MKFEQYLKEEKFDIKKLKCAECDSRNLVLKDKKIFCRECKEFVKAYESGRDMKFGDKYLTEAPEVNAFSRTIETDLTSYRIRMIEAAKNIIKNNFQVTFDSNVVTGKDAGVKGTYGTAKQGKLAGTPVTVTGTQPIMITMGHEVRETYMPPGLSIDLFLLVAVGRSAGAEKIKNEKELIRHLIKTNVPKR